MARSQGKNSMCLRQRNQEPRSPSRLAVGGLVITLLALGICVGAQEKSAPEVFGPYKDVVGRVVDKQSGQPVPGVVVSLLFEVTETDDSGRFIFEKIPVRHNAEMSMRVQDPKGLIIGCTTVDVPVGFYPVAAEGDGTFDIAVVDPGADGVIELSLEPLGAAAVDDYCAGCHRSNPCVEAATYEQVVRTRRDMRGIIVPESELVAFTEGLLRQGLQKNSYEKMRYQDTHPNGMNMDIVLNLDRDTHQERYKRPESLPLVEGKFVSCDTCHTRHVPTEHGQFARLPYEESNALCYECHL